MKRLKQERLQLGWSQQDLAVEVGMYSTDICRIERGYMKPYPSQAKKIEVLFGLPMESLLADINIRPDNNLKEEVCER